MTTKPIKIKSTIKSENNSYDFTLINIDKELNFKLEELNEFPIKIYELKIEFEKLKQSDQNLFFFKTEERLIQYIQTCIEKDKYSLTCNPEENFMIFEIKNEVFENGGAKIKIPERKQDAETKIEALTKTISEMRKEILNLKNKKSEKDEVAMKSFSNSSFLKDEEKKMISEWIEPNKIIRFNLLFNTSQDGDSSSTFHYYSDGVFPTVTVVLDTSGRRFGGYTTQNWCQSSIGGNVTRAPGSFIFNLTNKQKYELIDQMSTSAIYRHNSYGPSFGGTNDLYLSNQCKQNTSSHCAKSCYNTGNNNLLGVNGTTSFQVANYEVYQVIFE